MVLSSQRRCRQHALSVIFREGKETDPVFGQMFEILVRREVTHVNGQMTVKMLLLLTGSDNRQSGNTSVASTG